MTKNSKLKTVKIKKQAVKKENALIKAAKATIYREMMNCY